MSTLFLYLLACRYSLRNFIRQRYQLTPQLKPELHRLLGVKPIFTTPFHPGRNGRVERFHGPLKLCADKPRECHHYLISTLFALRDIPSDRMRFSAFELLYGHSVRAPLSVVRNLLEQRDLQADERPCFQYVQELQGKLCECSKLAAQTAD